MKASYTLPAEPSLEELRALRQRRRALEDCLEGGLNERERRTQAVERCLPRLLARTGASAIALTTRNAELAEETCAEGAWGERHPGPLLDEPFGGRRVED